METGATWVEIAREIAIDNAYLLYRLSAYYPGRTRLFGETTFLGDDTVNVIGQTRLTP